MSEQSSKPTLQEQILTLYSEGASDVEVAGALDLPKERFYQLYEENPAFKKIVDIGRTKAEAWWNHVGRRNLTSKIFQSSTWSMNMKNRFKWADKVDVGEKGNETPDDIAHLEREIKNTMKRIEQNSPAQARKIMEGSDD